MASLPRKHVLSPKIETESAPGTEAPAAYNFTPAMNVHPQTHEYKICTIDIRYNPEAPMIDIHAADGWRLIAVAGDVVRTLYFERAVKL